LAYISAADSMGLSLYLCGRTRSSKVINFGTNQKRVYYLLLVHQSNLRPILPRFRDIEGLTT